MTEKKYIDLHVHSNASDGTYSPTELVKYAIEKELYAFALTDHDTVAGIDEAKKAAKGKVIVLPGIEISADFQGTDLHILGLCVDYKNEEFLKQVEKFKNLRYERNLKMIEKMNECGFPLTKEILFSRYGSDASITRAHFARYLLDEGYVETKEEAFKKYLSKGGPCYVSRVLMTPKEAVETIIKAGGYPVLAHPLLYKFDHDRLFSVISYLKELGLVGIEAIYSLNSREDEEFLRKIAKRYDLFITGGSDFHGSNKPDIDLGRGRGNLFIPKELLDNMEREKWLKETI